jgi:hypothetical protein
MGRYRKKPVVIDAIRFDGHNANQIAALFGFPPADPGVLKHTIVIDTLEGEMTAHVGDWVIRGVAGEPYPCKNDIFEATYEAIAEEATR